MDLVVANPPYGERGAASVIDTDKAYRALDAADYFLMRSLDFLAPGSGSVRDSLGISVR